VCHFLFSCAVALKAKVSVFIDPHFPVWGVYVTVLLGLPLCTVLPSQPQSIMRMGL
jgi:hypothetical protein